MARNHKRAKRIRFTTAELDLIRRTNMAIFPFGLVSAIGPNAVGVFGDDRVVGPAVINCIRLGPTPTCQRRSPIA